MSAKTRNKRQRKEEGRTSYIKSNNPHLTGGEKRKHLHGSLIAGHPHKVVVSTCELEGFDLSTPVF